MKFEIKIVVEWLEILDNEELNIRNEKIKSYLLDLNEGNQATLKKEIFVAFGDNIQYELNIDNLTSVIVIKFLRADPNMDKENIKERLVTIDKIMNKLNIEDVTIETSLQLKEYSHLIQLSEGGTDDISDIELILRKLEENGIEFELVSLKQQRTEAGASGGFVEVILKIAGNISDVLGVLTAVNGISDYIISTFQYVDRDEEIIFKRKVSEKSNVHIDQLVLKMMKHKEDTGATLLVYRTHREYLVAIFNKKQLMTDYVALDSEDEISNYIYPE